MHIFDSILQLEKIIELDIPIIFFKHSSTCPISARAYDKIDTAIDEGILPEDKVYLIIVQEHRAISDRLEEVSAVEHESPQVIVWYHGAPAYFASHDAIDVHRIAEIVSMCEQD